MYLFSGEATSLNVMPDWAVMSVKAIFSRKGAKAQRKPQRRNIKALLIGLRSRLFFQLFRHLEMLLAFSFAPGSDVRATELIMNMRLIGLQARGNLKILNAAFHIAFLKQRFPELITRIAEVGPITNDLLHQLDAALCFLLGQHDKCKMIPGREVTRI